MTLQQLKFICEVVDRGFSISKAAAFLHTSQPSMSRQIQALERELGVLVFLRSKRRLIGLSKPGEEVHELARKAIRTTEGLRHIRDDFHSRDVGTLVVSTSHTQARYVLPRVIEQFKKLYPSLRVTLRQGNPAQITNWVKSGDADLSIGGTPIGHVPGVALLPCYDEHKIILTPRKHPLLKARPLTLEKLSRYPLITYDSDFLTNSQVTRAFARINHEPNVILSATNADVMKPYVRSGFGIAVVGALAYHPSEDQGLSAIDARHLFESSKIYIGIQKHTYVRRYVLDFIKLFEPSMTREKVVKAVFSD